MEDNNLMSVGQTWDVGIAQLNKKNKQIKTKKN